MGEMFKLVSIQDVFRGDRGEADMDEDMRDDVLEWAFVFCDLISSLSQRPLKRNFDLVENMLLELFTLGTSAPRLKLKIILEEKKKKK